MRFSILICTSFLLSIQLLYAQDSLINAITTDVIVRNYPLNKIFPDSIYGMNIVAGKKMEVLFLNVRDMDLSTNNYRQVFRKTPGIFVSDHDASGLQTSISTRGLSANRSWEFNMRQNGYDIAADPSGYPEAYYSPTLDAVASIEVYRGSSALQYGSQFGGMINYQLKDQIGERPLTYEGSHTAGSFGLFNSFNAIGGKQGAWTYYGFMHHRQAQGFRANSQYFTNTYFGKLGYAWKQGKITLEYTNSYYLNQQAGGLHDTMARQQADTSLRSRNWFELPWKMASIQLKHAFNNGLKIHATLNYLYGNRNSVGYMKAINVADTFNTATGSYNLRDVDRDIYHTISSEIRLSKSYKLGGKSQVINAGIRYCMSSINRLQKGIGTGGSDFDLSVRADNSGNLYQRDLDLQTQNAEETEKINQIKITNLDLEKEVGGFRFVAEAFGMELKNVVKFFIFLIVIVFDPLAVALIIAFNGLIEDKKKKQREILTEMMENDQKLGLYDNLDELMEKNYEIYGDSGKIPPLEEEISVNVENIQQEQEESPNLQWEEYMHPDFPWNKKNLWINNPKAVQYWINTKKGSVKELSQIRTELENTKTY